MAINEAVEIEKKYDEPDNSAFVNGILGGIIKKLRFILDLIQVSIQRQLRAAATMR